MSRQNNFQQNNRTPQPARNPLKPAAEVAPILKAVLHGETGVGKSYFSIEVLQELASKAQKRVAAICIEGGLAHLPAQGFDFDVVRPMNFREMVEAVQFVTSPAGQELYGAVLLDPITVVWHLSQQIQAEIIARRLIRNGKDPDDVNIDGLAWHRIKARVESIIMPLLNSPQHVILTARSRNIYENDKITEKLSADVNKEVLSMFETVCELAYDPKGNGRILRIEKDRIGKYLGGAGNVIPNPSAQTFAWASNAGAWKKVCESATAEAASESTLEDIDQTIDAITAEDAAAGEKAKSWYEGRAEKVAKSQERAEEVLNSLRKKLEGFRNPTSEASEEAPQIAAVA